MTEEKLTITISKENLGHIILHLGLDRISDKMKLQDLKELQARMQAYINEPDRVNTSLFTMYAEIHSLKRFIEKANDGSPRPLLDVLEEEINMYEESISRADRICDELREQVNGNVVYNVDML